MTDFYCGDLWKSLSKSKNSLFAIADRDHWHEIQEMLMHARFSEGASVDHRIWATVMVNDDESIFGANDSSEFAVFETFKLAFDIFIQRQLVPFIHEIHELLDDLERRITNS